MTHKKSNFHEENVQKIVIFTEKFPQNCKCQGIFFFASFSLQKISLFGVQYTAKCKTSV